MPLVYFHVFFISFPENGSLSVSRIDQTTLRSFTHMKKSFEAAQAKLLQFVFGSGFLLVVFYAFRQSLYGGPRTIQLVAIVTVFLSATLVLDEKFWILSSFFWGFTQAVPHVKFTGLELGSLLFISLFFLRNLFADRQKVKSSKSLVFAAIPFLTWMGLVWGMNPTGMNILGSSSLGGRFYFKVFLAFFAMLCLSSLVLSDKECRLFLLAFVFGNLAQVLYSVFGGNVTQAFFGAGTHYQFAHLFYLSSFFLCRYSIPVILTSFWPFFCLSTSFLLTLYSGNRHFFGETVLVAFLAPLVLKRERFKTYVLVFLSFFAVLLLAAGHGHLWNLPFSVQRALSFLPGRWDRRLESYGFHDEFRSILRRFAYDKIRASPWFGDGGFAIDLNEASWNYFNVNRSTEDRVYGHTITKNWHNVWLGMAADFGIPLSVAWAFFMAVLLLSGWKWVRSEPCYSWRQTAMVYFYLVIVVTFIDFWFNGGHSAKTPERIFVWAGMLCAAKNLAKNSEKSMEG